MARKTSTRNGATASGRSRTTKGGSSASRRRASTGSRTARSTGVSSTRGRTSSRTPSRAPARARGRSRSYVVPVVVLLVMVLAAWSLYPVARVQYRESRERSRLEAELEGLQTRNDDLRDQVDRLKTPEGVEDVARQTLGMVKEGENAYVVMNPDDESLADRPAQIADTGAPEDTLWRDLLDMVFGVQ